MFQRSISILIVSHKPTTTIDVLLVTFPGGFLRRVHVALREIVSGYGGDGYLLRLADLNQSFPTLIISFPTLIIQ